MATSVFRAHFREPPASGHFDIAWVNRRSKLRAPEESGFQIAPEHAPCPARYGTLAVFFIPAIILILWTLLDWWLIKDTPEEANFPHLDTHDASSGQMDVNFTTMELLRKVFTSRLMLFIAVVEMTSGVFRNGDRHLVPHFRQRTGLPGTAFFSDHWGLLLCIFGIIGGFAGGIISDKLFQSRRAPPAGILCAFVLIMALLMSAFLFSNQWIRRFRGGAHCDVRHRHHLADVRHGGDRFRRAQSDGHVFGIVDAFAYLGSGFAVRQPGIPDQPKLALVAGFSGALRHRWRAGRA